MHDLFAVADERQHRQDRLHADAIFPLPPSTQCEVGGIALRGMEAHVAQADHAFFALPNQPLKRIVRYIRCGTLPQTPPTHPFRQWSLKLTGWPRSRDRPLGSDETPETRTAQSHSR